MNDKEILKNSETLFKSVDRTLAGEYLDFWEASVKAMLELYKSAEVDGSEDSLRCRMIAATRLAQLGLCMHQFFGAASEAISSGNSDRMANEATARVVGLTVHNKVDKWLEKAKSGLN